MKNFDKTKNTKALFQDISLLDIALEIEKFLDFMNIYVYPNWIEGELVEGPKVSRYWIEITLRYDYNKMPDPMGARVLHDMGVICDYHKDTMMLPIDIKTPADFRPNSKKPKLLPTPVWHINLKIPRRFIDGNDYVELEDLDDVVDVDAVLSANDSPAPDQQGMPTEEITPNG